MSLAELISSHKPEMVVPYRDKPKYNPARRAQHNQDEHSNVRTTFRFSDVDLISAIILKIIIFFVEKESKFRSKATTNAKPA